MLNLKRVLSFVTVAEEGSLSRAAVRLHISQPALSRRLGELESDLGFSLFEPVGRGIRLTGEGRGFAVHCRELLAHATAVAESARLFASSEAGVLRVGASAQMLELVFPDVLLRYRAAFPAVDVVLLEGSPREHIRGLERGEVDFAVIPPQNNDALDSRGMVSFPVLVASSRKHRLRRGGGVDIQEIAEEKILVLHEGTATRQIFDAACRFAHIEPHIILESGAPHTMLALAEAGLGTAVVPATVSGIGRKLHVAPLFHVGRPLQVQARITWNRRHYLATYAERFIDATIAVGREKLSRQVR